MKFSAVILAGGKSSRMGRDKALLEVDGQSLLARQIQVVRASGASEVFISGRGDHDYTAFECLLLQDRFPNAGPIAGIQTALVASTTPHLLVLAVDMPEMSASLLQRLAEHCTETAGAISRVNGAVEPLAAFYPKAADSLLTSLLSAERSPPNRSGSEHAGSEIGAPRAKYFAECCVAAGLATFIDLPDADACFFANWNSPADIAELSPVT